MLVADSPESMQRQSEPIWPTTMNGAFVPSRRSMAYPSVKFVPDCLQESAASLLESALPASRIGVPGDPAKAYFSFKYLPTMAFYCMLLESDSYRRGFAEMHSEDVQTGLEVIHQEINKVCPYQVLISEDDFAYFNVMVSQSFLIKADGSLTSVIGRKLRI